MDKPIRFFIGLDVHKDSIAIAASEANSREEPRFIGTTGYSVHQVVKALSNSKCIPAELAIAYEAGPCGYGLARELIAKGYDCSVVAPSRVPRRPADRIKTDRRDALMLARLHRSAELVAVCIPDPSDEAVRDLTRAREDAVKAQRCARQQLMAMLLRLGKPYREGRGWTQKFLRYLADLQFEDAHHRIVFTEYRLAVQSAVERIERIEAGIRDAFDTWRWQPVVKALMCLRGIDFLSAMTIVAEIGDLRRFEHPRQLMSYLGLVPSEFSSGNSHQRGALTRTGNSRVRRVLIEAALELSASAKDQPRNRNSTRATTVRPHRNRVESTGPPVPSLPQASLPGHASEQVCATIARELVGFIWDIARRVRPTETPSCPAH